MGAMDRVSTGLQGLDNVIDGLRIGDNVVWQVCCVEEYAEFVKPFVQKALAQNRKVIYMRFGNHAPLFISSPSITIYQLNAQEGFEAFSTQIYQIVSQEGEEVFYVFDCLSDLLLSWATDLMIGNFFMITCPYLFESNTIAYFSILRNSHSFQTVARIRETTQLLLDVYSSDGKRYVHPLKVWKRYLPTMFLPHVQKGEIFEPVTNSVDVTRLFACMPKSGLENTQRRLDYWERVFIDVSDLMHRIDKKEEDALAAQTKIIKKLCKMMIGRDARILSLAVETFSLKDLFEIKTRLIGSGFIGGKAVGMLLARKILLREDRSFWEQQLEPHDSFYVGSDVFYTYLVQNGWWKLRMKQKSKDGYFSGGAVLKEQMLKGTFPDEIKEQFQQMLEYFGQSPIIVRSSSLLEDGFGNAFAGKYESIFCVNQGTPTERYQQFENAVRSVFASMMSEDALTYRLQRGLDKRDEQMALLVQRVSGNYHKSYFFPYLAGVGNSYNSYVWKNGLDPKAGMLRLVFGLGTRAVDRVEGDYPRIIALDAPMVQPHGNQEDMRKYSQHDVDVLDLMQNKHKSISLSNLMGENPSLDIKDIGVNDYDTNKRIRELGIKGQTAWILTYEKLLSKTPFIKTMRRMLNVLEKKYQYPVDVEFTANPGKEGMLHINLVQCRPLQTKGNKTKVEVPKRVIHEDMLFQSEGHFMGGSISQRIKRIIYVEPHQYCALNVSQKYELARFIGSLNREIGDKHKMPTILLGPGRWGTSTPSLGIPVTFSEINHMTVLGEIAFESAGLMPELSYGTHFFQDLVEADIFYVALFPKKENVFINTDWFYDVPVGMKKRAVNNKRFENVVKVIDVDTAFLSIKADILSQKILCYVG